MSDGRHVGKYSKCHNSPTNGPTGTQLGWSHPIIVPDMSAMMRLPWRRPLPSNGALNIMQSWASGGRTREPPILMKFGMQQQVRTTMTVMRSNIKIFKIQNGGRRPCWKIFEMPYFAYQWTDWDATWVVTSHHASDMSAMMRLPWQRPLPGNGALYIRQLWASGGRTRERILMKFGAVQKIRTAMTVT